VRVGRAILLTSALAISPLSVAPATATPLPDRTADPGQAAAGWLAAQVEAGGLTPSNLADAVIAFAAAGVGADAAATALGQLETDVDSYIVDGSTYKAGPTGKVMLAVAIAGGNVNSFGGHDLEAALRALMADTGGDAGRFGSALVFDQALAILALATTTGGVPAEAVAWLASKQCTDGDYSYDGSCPSWSPDPDSTAIAIQALQAAGETMALGKAETWLVAQQAPDGSLSSFGTPNSSSTAAAGQAYKALGHDAAAAKAAAWTSTLQLGCSAAPADIGSIPWAAGGTDYLLLSTPQAILGLGAGRLDQLSLAGASPTAPTLACPPNAPTGVTAISGAGQATVLWTSPAEDGGSAIVAYLVRSETGAHSCAPRPVDAGMCVVTGLPDGRYRFSVVAISAAGMSPTSNPSNRVTVDTTAPVVTRPVVGLRVGQQLTGVNVPVKVTWSGTDNVAGITAYTLDRSADGGSTYSGVTLGSPTATARSATLAAGTASHRFRVKAADGAGNVSAWTAGPPLAVSLVDDASAKVTYRGAWTTSAPVSASATTLHSTTSRGASASITFTGRGIAWVAPEGTNRGRATVYLDGRRVATVDLNDPASSRILVYAKSFGSSGQHTLRIVANGTAGAPRIDVDAFVIVK
jgi:hypothetical protein